MHAPKAYRRSDILVGEAGDISIGDLHLISAEDRFMVSQRVCALRRHNAEQGRSIPREFSAIE
jgi:hypothetical protein